MIKQLWIEPSGFCNLKCSMCGGNPRQMLFSKKTGCMSLKNLKNILNRFLEFSPNLKKVNFRGTGEPLINPKLPEMISYTKTKRLLTGITTNGSLLSLEKSKELLNADLDYLTLSIESLDKETYEKIRLGASLDNVKKNIEIFIKQKNAHKSKCKIGFNIVLQNDNVKQIPKIINYAAKIGIDTICLLNLENDYRKEHNTIIENGKIYGMSYKELLDEFKSWKKLSKNLHIELFLPPIKTYANKKCVFDFSGPIVTCDGYITPCCRMQELKYKMGNIFKQELKEIWDNNKYKEFRNGKNQFCQFCLKYLDRFENMNWLK
ncbi:MAG: radical SAM protein [bacterium]